MEPSDSEECSTSDAGWPGKFEYEIWTNEPMSVQERRQRFLKGMGLSEFVATRTDSFQCSGDGACCIRDLDSGRRYIVHNSAHNSPTGMLKEVGSDQGFIVGTITGACRFYNQSDENIQLEKDIFVQGKKKSTASRITSLKLCPSDPGRIIITSKDSKIRVANGDAVQKFNVPSKSKTLSSPYLTSDGRYLISAGKDSYVYIWNYADSGDVKSVHSCELFFSKDVSTAGSATWPEEKLPSMKPENDSQLGDCLSMASAAWNTVIVTASHDGVIRSFPNYGLPVRL
ncbi:hypothetical protein PR202_ga20382 [Eleusine coracana subsp. coracana]|uniref:Uncharacterized protein n=1 Tax=Eleusine coracana subsp. coracana TaxID=191504 RepID=A0AAV5CXW7_ELECO|nr:hypothetical protein PR202_ga20382 [Eleusine coracana subsp. coracana]